MTFCDPDRNRLVLDYATQAPGSAGEPVREAIDLETMPCHYGGERTWFRCPGCRSRRAVLFALGGRFRCRACHRLAYSSTRESAAARSYRRLVVLRSKLGGDYAHPVRTLPPRPEGMHHRTYDHLGHRVMRESGIHHDLANAVLDRILDRSRHP